MINGTRFRQSADIARQRLLSSDIARAQAEISSGKRIFAASDDPAGAARVASIGQTQANEKIYSSNLDYAIALAGRADSTLSSISTDIGRAREYLMAASTGTATTDGRAITATELRAIATDIDQLVATRNSNGQALFPGGTPLAIPVDHGVTVVPVDSADQLFTVTTAAGPVALSTLINQAADALELTDPVAAQAAISASLEAVNAADAHIITGRASMGARGERMDAMVERYATSALALTEERSVHEDVDVTSVVALLRSKQTSLDAAQAIYARINQQSLFDLIR